jgi:predicted transposase/invertase (TIGR01784 family)
MGTNDLSYRRLFSQPRMVRPRMVRELLRDFVEESWIERLDFSTLERVNASYVSKTLKNREGDLVWKLRLREGETVYVYILLELQSEVQPFMAVRLMVYLGLLYQDLIDRGELLASGKLPLVLPIVLYNGAEPWGAALELSELIDRVGQEADAYLPRLRYRIIDEGSYRLEELEGLRSAVAELFRLERNRKRADIERGSDRLGELLQSPEDAELRHAFVVWMKGVLFGRVDEGEIPDRLGLEEFRNMLEKTVQQWNRELREEGRQEGREEGRREGRREGRQEGRREGRQEGRREAKTEVLLQLLEQRFGPLDSHTLTRLRTAEEEQIRVWTGRLLTAGSLEGIFEDGTH